MKSISKLINSLNGNFFLKNLLVLMSGNTLAQLITILSSLILTRLYGPEEFGDFAIFMSIISILTVIITMRYEVAIIAPKNDADAASLLFLSVYISIFISFITFIILLIFKNIILKELLSGNINVYVIFIPISILLLGIYNSLRYWNIRKQKYVRTTNSQLGNSLSTNFSQIIFGIINFMSLGLVYGKLIGLIVSTFIISIQFIKEDYREMKKSLNYASLKKNLVNYSQYPLYNVPQSLLNSLSTNLIPILIGVLYNSTLLGLYALTIRVLFVPVGIIGNTFKDVFFQRASALNNDQKDLEGFYSKSIVVMTLIFIPFSLIFFLKGPELFSIIFGDEWIEAGEISRWISLWVLFIMMSRPAVALMQIFEKQKLNLKIEFFSSITKLFLFIVISLVTNDFVFSLIIFICVNIIQYIFLIYIGYKEIKIRRKYNEKLRNDP